MKRLLFIALVLVTAFPIWAADPLTTPIAETATQYRLDSVNFDIEGQRVTMQFSLLDSGGAVLRTHAITLPVADLGLTVPQLNAIRQGAVQALKTRGRLN